MAVLVQIYINSHGGHCYVGAHYDTVVPKTSSIATVGTNVDWKTNSKHYYNTY